VTESARHAQLVDALVSRAIALAGGTQFTMCADLAATNYYPRPPPIGSVRPDMFATFETSGLLLLGEAKTAWDVDNPHTLQQLKDYFEYLQVRGTGELWLAVPIASAGEMYRVAQYSRSIAKCSRVPFQVSGWMFGPAAPVTRIWHG